MSRVPMGRPVRALLALLAGTLLLAGCTGVPTTSAPETIEALDTGPATGNTDAPPALGSDPRTLVESFLDANAVAGSHNTARAYLSTAARARWTDTTATVIANDGTVGTYDDTSGTVVLRGRVLGTVNAAGIYTPALQGTGSGGQAVPFVFKLSRTVDGQYRIDELRNGLILTDDQFRRAYQQHVLYFYDLAEQYLVPDARWSSLTDRTQLAQWLLTQLVNGPRPELSNAVSTDTLPAQADARRMTVDLGTPTRIEIPGSSQLDAGVRDRLAAQVSQSLGDAVSGRAITITDGGTPVQIPQVHDTAFAASDFSSATGPDAPPADVYFLVNGRVYTEADKPLAGPLGDGSVYLSSLAVSRPGGAGPLRVAAVEGSGTSARLLVGTTEGLRATSVRGQLSRPAFAPGQDEVWVADGSKVYRVGVEGAGSKVTEVPVPAASGGGQVLALRISPEGSRIALVVSGAGGTSQLYVGSIVRGAGQVRVDTLDAVSPQGVVVRDVAWLDSLKLFAIGYLAGSQDSRTFESGVDGSEWATSSIGNLPQPPDSVTVATAASVWVSANGYVWKQSGSQWVSPGAEGQTAGTAPVYVE